MDADQTWVMDFLANVEKLGRILVAPPGIPPARLAYLQEAIKDHAAQSAAHRRRREGRAHHRVSRSARHRSRTRRRSSSSVTPAQKQRVLDILGKAK